MTQSSNPSEAYVREGEVTVELPAQTDAGVYFIGKIHTPWQSRKECPKNAGEARERGTVCTIELDPRFQPALKGLETCTHIVVLYWMHKVQRDLLVQVPGTYGVGRGTFSLRSPVRPNPIAMSVVRLLKIEENRLEVIGLDCLDGTPLIDLKPYFPSVDSVPDAVVGWHAERKAEKT